MFTGIVTAIGRLVASTPHDGGLRLAIDALGLPGEDLVLGESIAVAGVCLTVTGAAGRRFDCDVSGETLRLTTLGRRAVGDAVNLERALRAGDRLGGHLVSGHVDGIGRLRGIAADGLSGVFRFEVPAPLRRYLAPKGSITVDGTSLTVNAVDAEGFTVNLIPHTLAHTTLGALAPGDAVNLEVDQVARYVERLLAWRDAAPAP
ncbi:MAG: riboflavin synthase [Pseudoxanthomonas sp.]|nr:riboflavin synthase [Pseudoxanthomonas sp.]